jgi:uncharacterized membrane protein
VRTRLIACLIGGCLGLVLAPPINGSLGLNPTVALIGCALAGLVLGYVASVVFAAFTVSPEEEVAEPENMAPSSPVRPSPVRRSQP